MARPETNSHNQRLETSGLSTDYNFLDDAKEWTPQLPHPIHSLSYPWHPPPLLPRRLVPLPAMTSGPVVLHPLLAHQWHHGSVPPIFYDLSLPPETAVLAPALRNRSTRLGMSWKAQPAVGPYTAASMTLRVPALSRGLVIVFPARLEDSIVTIADVLRSVHAAFLLQAAERHSGSTFLAEESGIAVRGCIGGPVWWAGLQPSSIERDVWILQVTKGRRLP